MNEKWVVAYDSSDSPSRPNEERAGVGKYLTIKRLLILVAVALFLSRTNLPAQTNLYVAADGSAPFTSVQSAIMAVPSGSHENPVIIHIAPGTYRELVYIQREKRFFRLVGENPTNTILIYNLYAGITK